MKPLYIFDLDGTLADLQHGAHIVDEKHHRNRWRRFHPACDRDIPIRHAIHTMELLRRFADIWIFSGRSEEVRGETVAWLMQNTSFSESELERILTMRQEGDHRADDIVKREWLDGLQEDDRKRLVAAFDDRDKVVAMWRAAGIPCYQVARGDF